MSRLIGVLIVASLLTGCQSWFDTNFPDPFPNPNRVEDGTATGCAWKDGQYVRFHYADEPEPRVGTAITLLPACHRIATCTWDCP